MTITIHLDFDTGRYELWCHTPGMSEMPAGERLFKAPPYPDIRFNHDNQQDAERDAALLRKYLAEVAGRKPTAKQVREAAA